MSSQLLIQIKLNRVSGETELIKSLEKLPAVLRIPMIMKEINSLNYEKIAELIDVPDGVIATRIYRARKLLFLFLFKNYSYEDEKRKWKQRDSTKQIFELRKCALFIDDELTKEQNSVFIESTKNNNRYENEILIQETMKKLFKNCSSDDSSIARLKSKIERKARKKFNQH